MEFLRPQDDPSAVDAGLAASGVGLALFNTGRGEQMDDRGLLTIPGRDDDLRAASLAWLSPWR